MHFDGFLNVSSLKHATSIFQYSVEELTKILSKIEYILYSISIANWFMRKVKHLQ